MLEVFVWMDADGVRPRALWSVSLLGQSEGFGIEQCLSSPRYLITVCVSTIPCCPALFNVKTKCQTIAGNHLHL